MEPTGGDRHGVVEIVITPAQQVTTDQVSGGLRTFFDPVARPLTSAPFLPRDLALQVLKSGAARFRWQPALADLLDGPVIGGENFSSVRFHQSFKGVPVDAAEVVVNLCADGRLQSLYSQYRYDIPPALDPARIKFDHGHASALVRRLSRHADRRTIGQPRLIVYQHPRARLFPLRRARRRGHSRNRFLDAVRRELARARRGRFSPRAGRYYLAWEIVLEARRPLQRWRVLIDGVSGHLLRVQDLLSYSGLDGAGRVFDPNPNVTSGDPSLSWNDLTGPSGGGTRRTLIRQQLFHRVLPRLSAPESPKHYRLHGTYVEMAERDDPKFAEPVQPTPRFVFGPTSRKFLDVMAYYHIDRFQDYVQTSLGLAELGSLVAKVDPQGYDRQDQSAGSAYQIVFGEGTPPNAPDASDGTIVLHEYGHALQDKALPGSAAGMTHSGVSEGFADWLAAVYYDDKHVNPAATRGIWGLWGKSPNGQRSCRVTTRFDDPAWDQWDGYKKGEVWSSTLFEIYRELGGDSQQPAIRSAARDLILRLHLMANRGVATQDASSEVPMPPATTLMAHQILGADNNLAGWPGAPNVPRYANGLHQKVISDAFSRRALPGFPARPVDVYIDDGRRGGYGSPLNNPTFDDALWIDSHGDPPGVWVQTSNGAAAAPGAASVKIGVPAHVFVRVTNRGGSNSAQVTVKVFAAQPGSARVWPGDWSPLAVAPAAWAVPDVPAGQGVLVGPFSWTPANTGACALLVIVECQKDQALTELLQPADRVPFMDLVPFDNNIAMRDILVTA